MTPGDQVRALARPDLDWVVELATRAAGQRQAFAPLFWRRAPGARRIHARYLGELIDDPEVPAVRTGHAFAIGLRRGARLVVDDAAAELPTHWATEGPALLLTEPLDARSRAERRAAARGAVVSVVTRPPDDPRYRRTCDFYEGTVSAR